MTKMKPRSSSGGLLSICQYSHFLDSQIANGVIPPPDDVEESSSSYADLGTIIHGRLQHRMGCVMQTTIDEALQPLLDNASKLFKSAEDMEEAINANVDWCLTLFPKAKDGKAWVAEPQGETAWLTGHLDFESQDGKEIIDLKTTSRKPDNRRMKPLHFTQLVCYWILRGRKAESARILYVDSLKGSWAILTETIDFTNPMLKEYADSLEETFCGIMDPDFAPKSPEPVPGPHCKDGYCKYRNSKLCYASLIPSGDVSETFENKAKAKPSALEGPKVEEVKLW